MDQKVKKKRERSDRSEKLKRRKATVETVVKASLLKHLRGDSKQAVRDAIQARAKAFSQRYYLASIALSGMLKECFNGAVDAEAVAGVALPDLTCQSFYRQLMLGVENARMPNPFVQAYYQAHTQLAAKLPKERHQGDRNIYSAGAKKYMTNFRNHYVVNFKTRLSKFLRAFQDANGLTDEQRTWMLFRTCGWPVPTDLEDVPQLPAMQLEVDAHRRILGLAQGASVTPRWLDSNDNLHRLVRHGVHVSRFLEQAGLPTFNLVPIARRGAHFITIDTSVLFGLLKELEVVQCNEQTFESLADEQWSASFAINKLRGAGREFTHTVDTDGTSICVHFRRDKQAGEDVPVVAAAPRTRSPLADSLDDYNVLGNDPGRSNIYYFAVEYSSGETNSWKLTRKQYYVESGIIKARQQAMTFQLPLQQALQQLSEVSSKGTSVVAHQRFLDTVLELHDQLWAEYLKPRWANQRLRLYGGKKRVFASFLNRVERQAMAGDGKPLVVAYGAAKFAPGGRGELAVPTSRAYKECLARFRTVLVDEFRSTMVNAFDGSVMKQVWSRRKGAAVRGLMWCGSTNNGKFVNRDLNAALNIRRCLASPVRPMELCRVPKQARLQKVVGKAIRC